MITVGREFILVVMKDAILIFHADIFLDHDEHYNNGGFVVVVVVVGSLEILLSSTGTIVIAHITLVIVNGNMIGEFIVDIHFGFLS